MKTILLLITALTPIFAGATKYISLQDGNWNNATNVWSHDGFSPCGCSPSTVLSGDTVIINHAIVQNVNLNITNQSNVKINVGGSLSGLGMVTTIQDSEMLAYGNVSTKKLVIANGGIFTIQLAELYVETRVENYGTLNLNTANLEVNLGNVNIYSSATFNLTGGSKLHYQSGNFNNYGETNLCDQCCISLSSGNIQNNAGASLNGGGSMISDNGNVQNDGYWDVNIKWCSAGNDFGMPTPEDCATANANCAGVPLPVELAVFEVSPAQGYNVVVWITASEVNCDYFILERSEDGINWSERAMVDGAGTTTLETSYSVRDNVDDAKTYYYRLIQYDFNMEQTISSVISVHAIGHGVSELYPNPSNGEFFLVLDGHEPGLEIKIFDINGTQVYAKSDIYDDKVAFQLQLVPGLYLVNVNRGQDTETLKLIIR